MPDNFTQAIIESAQDAQSTHNKVTSNAAAMLAIRLASRYLLQKTDTETPAQSTSSAAATSSSSAASSSVVVPACEMTIEMTGHSKAQEWMSRVRMRYEGRVKSSLLEAPTKAWLAATLGSRTLSKELDRVTLVEEHNGQPVSTEWYLPLPEVYAVVLSALIDLDEKRWPVPPHSTAKNERLQRLQEFDRINNALAKATPRICSTGIRHAWLMALDGYEGKRLPLNAEDVLMQGLFDFMVREVLGKQMNINLPDGRDPVGAERATFHEHFQSLFLPWAYGTMPGAVRNAIKKAGGSDAARDFVLERFRTIGIAPDEQMMQKINGYCSKTGLQSIPCNFIPILAALERHAKRHTLALSSGSITATGLRPLAEDTLVWLQGVDFSPESLANPAHEKAPLSILYLVLRLHDSLYQYKDYKNLLDVCDMPEDNKDAWVEALHVYSQCLQNPDLSLTSLLEDTVRLEERLRAFERGFAMWRNGAYHDFISNYAANWFAASGNEGIAARASLFARLCDLYFRENTEGSNSIPAIRVPDAMLDEWIAKAGEDGVLEVTPYQINRILLHALCYLADTWSLLFQQCLPKLLSFIRNRCNQEQNTAGDALSRDSWPEALLAQVERIAAPDSAGEPSVPVLLTPGTITPESSLDIARLLAASKDMPEAIVRQIVELPGFNPHATNRDELTPFYLAAEYGNINFASALMGKGVDCEVKFRGKFHPLQAAIDNCYFSFVLWFFQSIPKQERFGVLMEKNDKKITLLHLIAKVHPGLLKLILDLLPETIRGHAVMTFDSDKDTVLHLATRKSPELLKLLLVCLPETERVNATMAKNQYGETALHWIARYNPMHLKEILNCLPEAERADVIKIKSNADYTALGIIAVYQLKFLKEILDCLPEADRAEAIIARYENGNSPLHYAITQCPEILEQLLNFIPESDKEKAVMIANNHNNNLLHAAAPYNEILKLFVDYLPEEQRAHAVMECNLDGNNVLHLASDNPESLKLLLDTLPEEERANAIMICNKEGYNLLHKAAINRESLKVLLDCMSESEKAQAVIKKTNYGASAIHLAANEPQSLKLLLDCLHETDRAQAVMRSINEGRNLLLEAKSRTESLKLLMDCIPEHEKEKAVMACSSSRITSLHLACQHDASLKLLLDCLPETAKADAVMFCDHAGKDMLHWAAKNPASLKLLMDCLPEATRADAVIKCNHTGKNVLQEALSNPQSLEQILSSLPEAARVRVILAKNIKGESVLDQADYLYYDQSKLLLEAVLEQAQKQTTPQLSEDSAIPDCDTSSAPSSSAPSSETSSSTPLVSHSLFSQNSPRLQVPDSPGEQSTLKR
ncbi:hypothetical protein ELY21_11765 [Legionella sp. km535]|uniref:ankyrin repeat domain-containing protein n=1 Tax=Legionella sp. km535 TaxID=2498107 RepID=UPI000F8CC60D|nr:ankyrin repeat domain-containing protein [Legionella sp. km535]RUR17233.1 hypothetical protein ELY21_11765 [Legionella sp. km535]